MSHVPSCRESLSPRCVRATRAAFDHIALLATVLVAISCDREPAVNTPLLPAALTNALDSLSNDEKSALGARRVFFVHQSVGAGIVSGLRSLAAERPSLGIRIVRSARPDTVDGGAFIHAALGENGSPIAKTDGFVQTLLVSGEKPVDIGMQKFCYADFERDIDPDRLFVDYEAKISLLRAKRPDVLVVHVTTPLLVRRRASMTIVKDLVKSVIGRTTTNDRMRGVRRFNQLMRARYGTTNALFDLAAIEGRGIDRRSEGAEENEALAVEFATPDGGHLNALGQRVLAAELLLFLAALPVQLPRS